MKDLTSFQKAVGRSIDSRQGFKTVKNHRIFFGLFPSFFVQFFSFLFVFYLFPFYVSMIDISREDLYCSFHPFNKEKHHFLIFLHMVLESWKARIRV